MCMWEPYKLDKIPDVKNGDEIRKHLPVYITQDHISEADTVLPGYMFKTKVKRDEWRGYCTKCGADVEIMNWRHNDIMNCPNCGSDVVIKDAGRGRKHLKHNIYLLYYHISAADPNVIVGAGAFFTVDYSGDYRAARTEAYLWDVYIFSPGIGGKRHALAGHYDYKNNKSKFIYTHFYKYRRVTNPSTGSWGETRRNVYECVGSLEDCIHAAGWEKYMIFETEKILCTTNHAHCEVMNFNLRTPCVEYLLKMGQTELIRDRLERHLDMRKAIKWKGKTAGEVLGLSGQQLHEVKNGKIMLNTNLLLLAREIKQANESASMIDLEKCAKYISAKKLIEMCQLNGRGILRTLKYLKKQSLNKKSIPWRDYPDYLDQCKQLEMNIKDDAICFPRDLNTKHQELTERIRYKADKKLNQKIKERLKELNKIYSFQYGGLMMRPAYSSVELVREGNALCHCVGSYAMSYADGRTDICVIRRQLTPDVPFHTAEFKAGSLIQCRGYRNQTEEADRPMIDAFLKAFNEHIQTKTRRKAV